MMMKLFVGDARGFAKINNVHIILIPKKSDTEEIGDCRPVILIHSIPKLFKVFANCLQNQMPEIIAMNQFAFIQGIDLHDKFLLVRQVLRKIHAMKFPEFFSSWTILGPPTHYAGHSCFRSREQQVLSKDGATGWRYSPTLLAQRWWSTKCPGRSLYMFVVCDRVSPYHECY